MIELFGCIILTALFVNGITIASGEDMLLEGFKNWLRNITKIHKRVDGVNIVMQSFIYKPLIGCVKCMPSIYGTIICLLFLPFDTHLIYQIPVCIACSSTLATIINQQYP